MTSIDEMTYVLTYRGIRRLCTVWQHVLSRSVKVPEGVTKGKPTSTTWQIDWCVRRGVIVIRRLYFAVK